MPYKFVFFTWILVVPLNILSTSIALALATWIETGNISLSVLMIDFDSIETTTIVSLIFSLPGLFGLMLLVRLANEFIYAPRLRFTFICWGCALVTIGCYVLLELILTLNIGIQELVLFVSGSLLAVLISLFITRKHYYSSLNIAYEQHKV
jgi:hypothetical protein